MHTPTVFDSKILDTFKELELSDEKLHHLKNVLRIKDMDEIKTVSYTHLTLPTILRV